MVKCKQQKNGWERGFMIINHMYEFVNSIQHDFPIKRWNEKRCLPQKEIDKLILDLTPSLSVGCFQRVRCMCFSRKILGYLLSKCLYADLENILKMLKFFKKTRDN